MFVLNMLPLFISATGIFFLVKLRGFFIFHPIRTAKKLLSSFDSKKTFKSLSLALAGTLGVGNIVGVAVGISVGGAGSIFWLIVSALLSSVIKYAEATLSKDLSSGDKLGMIAVIKKSFHRFGTVGAEFYAILCLALSLILGTAVQSRAIAESGAVSLNLSEGAIALPLVFLVAIIIVGGAEKIEKATAFIIPLTALVYISLCLCIIISNITKLPCVISRIVSEAFTFEGGAGGMLGFITSKSVSEGFARGMLSNEAGAGTSSFAHTRDTDSAPCVSGICGIAEVLFDTVILCTLSGVSLLIGDENILIREYGMSAVSKIFTLSLGHGAGVILFLCVACFALSTIICQYYYGAVCAEYLFGKKYKYFYFPIFLSSCALGLFFTTGFLVTVSDFLLFSMTVLTLTALIKNARRIKKLTKLENLI